MSAPQAAHPPISFHEPPPQPPQQHPLPQPQEQHPQQQSQPQHPHPLPSPQQYEPFIQPIFQPAAPPPYAPFHSAIPGIPASFAPTHEPFYYVPSIPVRFSAPLAPSGSAPVFLASSRLPPVPRTLTLLWEDPKPGEGRPRLALMLPTGEREDIHYRRLHHHVPEGAEAPSHLRPQPQLQPQPQPKPQPQPQPQLQLQRKVRFAEKRPRSPVNEEDVEGGAELLALLGRGGVAYAPASAPARKGPSTAPDGPDALDIDPLMKAALALEEDEGVIDEELDWFSDDEAIPGLKPGPRAEGRGTQGKPPGGKPGPRADVERKRRPPARLAGGAAPNARRVMRNPGPKPNSRPQPKPTPPSHSTSPAPAAPSPLPPRSAMPRLPAGITAAFSLALLAASRKGATSVTLPSVTVPVHPVANSGSLGGREASQPTDPVAPEAEAEGEGARGASEPPSTSQQPGGERAEAAGEDGPEDRPRATAATAAEEEEEDEEDEEEPGEPGADAWGRSAAGADPGPSPGTFTPSKKTASAQQQKHAGKRTGRRARKKQKTMRQCQHCGQRKTPQWRGGPLEWGEESFSALCNRCGVLFRSGRVVPLRNFEPFFAPSEPKRAKRATTELPTGPGFLHPPGIEGISEEALQRMLALGPGAVQRPWPSEYEDDGEEEEEEEGEEEEEIALEEGGAGASLPLEKEKQLSPPAPEAYLGIDSDEERRPPALMDTLATSEEEEEGEGDPAEDPDEG